MSREKVVFKINGYWKDDNTSFEDYIVVKDEYHEFDDAEFCDNQIFFYGMSEDFIKNQIKLNYHNSLDFVIEDYKVIK